MPIKLKPAAQMGGTLEPGELAIDEAGRKLYIEPANGLRVIPLDRVPVPPPPATADPRMVLLSHADGPAYGLLSAGSGGRSILTEPGWFAPGIALTSTLKDIDVTSTAQAPYAQYVDVAQPIYLRRLLVMPKGGQVGNYAFGLAQEDGTPIIQFNGQAENGWVVQPCERILQAGRYRTYLEVVDPLVFQGFSGQQQWNPLPGDLHTTDHIIFLRLN